MEIFASPEGGTYFFWDEKCGRAIKRTAQPLGPALARAGAGDVVRLAGGRYRHPIFISTRAHPDAPLRIIGEEGALIDPGLPPAPARRIHLTPDEDDFAFFRIYDASWVTIERMAFINCWPCLIYLRGCQHITIKGITGKGAQYVVFARTGRRNDGHTNETAHICLSEIHWRQDPARRMWLGEISWSDIKTFRSHDYLNGSLFGSWDISGHVEISNCLVEDAFNVVRMDCDREGTGPLNTNVNIHHNRFFRVRDNVIEPETRAYNWWVHCNLFANCHAPFSLHDLRGGWFYIFGNEFWFDCNVPGDDHTGGKVFMFRRPASNEQDPPMPTAPLYTFHNSAFIRTAYTKDGETRHWKHYNNAIEFCFSGPYCSSKRGFFSSKQANSEDRFLWDDSHEFAGDVSNHPEFPSAFPPEWALRIADGVNRSPVFGVRHPQEGLFLDNTARDWHVARPFTVRLPDGSTYELSKNAIVGARQSDGKLYSDITYTPAELDVLLKSTAS